MRARDALAGMCWTAAPAAVGVRGITGTWNVLASLAWLRAADLPGEPRRDKLDADSNPYFVVVLPMLREQRLIAQTVNYFVELVERWGAGEVVLATTEREHAERRRARRSAPGTPELAAGLADATRGVRHYHLADPAGAMAHQVNHAATAELARLMGMGIQPRQIWLAIYNADSRPSAGTLHAVAAVIRRHPDARIVQQPAVFTSGLGAGILSDGAALLQSRWTLARRSHAYAAKRTKRALRLAAHIVGHGWPTALGTACTSAPTPSGHSAGCRPRP